MYPEDGSSMLQRHFDREPKNVRWRIQTTVTQIRLFSIVESVRKVSLPYHCANILIASLYLSIYDHPFVLAKDTSEISDGGAVAFANRNVTTFIM